MLSRYRLLIRTFRHHARAMTLLLVTAAVAAAIVTGALFVGDSVRGSLRGRVEERLGAINYTVVAAGFFRQGLAQEVHNALNAGSGQAVAVVLVDGAITHAETEARAGGVKVRGIPPEFWSLGDPRATPEGAGEPARRVIYLSAEVAAAVGAKVGDSVLFHFQKEDDVPAEHALGRRTGVTRPTRLEVRGILPATGLALFDADNAQRPARNVFVPLETLQRILEREDLANAVLLSTPVSLEQVQAALRKVWQLEDIGLRLRPSDAHRYIALESRALVLPRQLLEPARETALAAGVRASETLAYLANSIAAAGKSIPYSTVAACEAVHGEPIALGSVVLNTWAAAELGVAPGAKIQLSFYTVEAGHQLREVSTELELARVVPIDGDTADSGWTPEYPGISDARSLRAWDPPFPVDLDRIRDQDEAYWTEHKTTPKAFVALADGKRLWTSRFGETTAVRFEVPAGESAAELAGKLQAALKARLHPADFGLSARAVKEEGLRAAGGATDFGVLFVSFSFFIIVSALTLLAMSFRLSCERRARELGVLAACGFDRRALTRQLLAEGAVIGGVGSAAGAVLGLGYAALLVWGLRTLWREAVNAPFLSLHTTWLSWLLGPLATLVFALATLTLVACSAARAPPRVLLTGSLVPGSILPSIRGSRWAGVSATFLAFAGVGLLVLSAQSWIAVEAAFFGGGACFLGACLGLFRVWLGKRRFADLGAGRLRTLSGFGARALSRAPMRALLTASLIASATFVLTAVAASRRDPGGLEPRRDSGNGGFSLVASAATPLLSRLDSAPGREDLGLRATAQEILRRTEAFAFRVRPGDDASCLNLYRPRAPRVLGASAAFLKRGGFRWSASLAERPEDRANPWRLLAERFPDGAIPAIGDANTVQWILHSGLGKDIVFTDDAGLEVRLRLVGLLAHSLFQGELVVAEEQLIERFPGIEGTSWFLLAPAPQDLTPLASELESSLAGNGFDVETTASLLASYQAVENTYLSTFQILGGMGLLLGTLGLGVVLLRNVHERRGELGLLRAVGASRPALAVIILGETLVLLAVGLVAGATSAGVAILPSAWSRQGNVPWLGLAAMIGAIALVGLASAAAALRSALKTPILTALRRE